MTTTRTTRADRLMHAGGLRWHRWSSDDEREQWRAYCGVVTVFVENADGAWKLRVPPGTAHTVHNQRAEAMKAAIPAAIKKVRATLRTLEKQRATRDVTPEVQDG